MHKMHFPLIVCLLTLALHCTLPTLASDGLRWTKMLQETFSKNDIAPLKSCMSARCNFNSYPVDLSNVILTKYVRTLTTLQRVDLISQRQTGDTCRYLIDMTFSSPTRFIPVELTEMSDSIVNISFLPVNEKSLEKAVTMETEPSARYHFRLLQNMIVLDDVLIDGFRGTFVLDTGANGTVLNATTAFPFHIQNVVKSTTRSVHGTSETATQIVKVDSLCLGGTRWRQFRVSTSPLAATQQQLGLKELTGMMGMSLFSGCQLHIDYDHCTLWFENIDAQGNTTNPSVAMPKCQLSFSILSGYAPMLDVQIGGRTYKMMYDSGSAVTVFSADYHDQLKPLLLDEKKSDLIGGNDKKVQVTYARLKALDLGTIKAQKVQSLFVQKSMYSGTVGILGTNVFKGHSISINMKKQLFCIY
jgi:hypothetical protein